MKKNIYLLSYIPFISILMFGMAFSLYVYDYLRVQMSQLGLYEGLSTYITAEYLNITVFLLVLVLILMLLSLLKLFAETLLKFSFMFFARGDENGSYFIYSQIGSLFYLVGGILSIFCSASLILVAALLLVSTLCYFVYVLYKLGNSISLLCTVGIILFQIFSWLIIINVAYILLVRLFNYGLKQFLSIV